MPTFARKLAITGSLSTQQKGVQYGKILLQICMEPGCRRKRVEHHTNYVTLQMEKTNLAPLN